MTKQSVFAEQLKAGGYTLRTRTECTFTPSSSEKECVSISEPFHIHIHYEPEYFGLGLPMYVLNKTGQPMLSSAFYHDIERCVQAHLYRRENGTALVVQRCSYTDGTVCYIVEQYGQNNN